MKPETEIRYLERCIELANQCSAGIGTPLVGAILVSQDGTIIGEGYRQFIDGTQLTLHAERIAITQAKEQNRGIRGTTLITTLEPCTRKRGRRDILSCCCELISAEGIKRVIIGSRDINLEKSGVGYLITQRIRTDVLYENNLPPELRRKLDSLAGYPS